MCSKYRKLNFTKSTFFNQNLIYNMTESTFQGSTLGYDKQTTSLISQCYQYYHQFHQNKNCQHLCSRIPCSCHAGEHFTSCFRHVHLKVLQSVWQLHLMILKSSSGAGGKSVCTGISFSSQFSQPHSNGSRSYTFHSCI